MRKIGENVLGIPGESLSAASMDYISNSVHYAMLDHAAMETEKSLDDMKREESLARRLVYAHAQMDMKRGIDTGLRKPLTPNSSVMAMLDRAEHKAHARAKAAQARQLEVEEIIGQPSHWWGKGTSDICPGFLNRVEQVAQRYQPSRYLEDSGRSTYPGRASRRSGRMTVMAPYPQDAHHSIGRSPGVQVHQGPSDEVRHVLQATKGVRTSMGFLPLVGARRS